MNPSDDDYYDPHEHAAFLAEQEAFEADYHACFSPDLSPRDVAQAVWDRVRSRQRNARPVGYVSSLAIAMLADMRKRPGTGTSTVIFAIEFGSNSVPLFTNGEP